MKILTVVGARPQFIKAAPVSRQIRKKHQEVLLHTGQHFDDNMSDVFFREMGIPKPDYNLGMSGGTHAQMTGKMMIGIEEVLEAEKPDWLLVYGDTNSTLAAALAAAKLHVPICHVEAGCRTHRMTNPEEINRVCTDHISSLLLMSTRGAIEELEKEGLKEKSVFVGDPMYDAFIEYKDCLSVSDLEVRGLDGKKETIPSSFNYLTCHREENTFDDSALNEIFKAMDVQDIPTIYPVHPRNKERALRLVKKNNYRNIILIEPVGYLESICLVSNSNKVVTDSGGVQREAFFAGKKCVTVLDFVSWPETMVCGRNTLSKPYASDIEQKLKIQQKVDSSYMPFGDGKSAERIVKELETHSNEIYL
ncbi:UDP-N-acetylglucosamine 2-epimerase (non-hydrolysing) [Butyrivibrio sp. Su6]|uniref:non-hydrolyzing UDP-N-acetylglucosamine 2-epimerase n=1 Tax=Butyrivibrio sp. Su6 TaxID=1520810 RepID=UPI00089EB3F8|nr:UDP-N-acetylglucosamine 2-epimerase (non-hydrolyzing) [Butyrivibrio sp. Su6]SEG16865.1 UDP-N-acetylglucosamine 2-epimerase (non-hydrolysing) [Butyrivibrio sp. Su6]